MTLKELKASGWKPQSVKAELRRNLIRKLQQGESVFEGLLGYDDTVIPQLQHAILAQHDFILLGLRGQGKTRLLRALTTLLDEKIPYLEGTELNDNPFEPLTKKGKAILAEFGDDARIAWLTREERYTEKLATPDTSIADLIGDIDPIKAATQRLTYADEEVIHFGLIPRANRGIFAINELPDLQPRIQVGLLNIMEEQDIQIRGFNLRIPLDLLLVFSANPEDYTNRGSIITPLKDRIDSQIITHYPKSTEIGIEITRQEAWQERDTVQVNVPHFFREIIEEIAVQARKSEFIDPKSGVSVRLTRSALEALISSAERRALLNQEAETVTRISDLVAVEAAITGKIELVYEGEQEGASGVAHRLIGLAIRTVFNRYFPSLADKKAGRAAYQPLIDWFNQGNQLTLTHTLSAKTYTKSLNQIPKLATFVQQNIKGISNAECLVGMEWVIEALHQHSLIGKEIGAAKSTYSDLMGSMFSGNFGADTDDTLDFDFDDDEE